MASARRLSRAQKSQHKPFLIPCISFILLVFSGLGLDLGLLHPRPGTARERCSWGYRRHYDRDVVHLVRNFSTSGFRTHVVKVAKDGFGDC